MLELSDKGKSKTKGYPDFSSVRPCIKKILIEMTRDIKTSFPGPFNMVHGSIFIYPDGARCLSLILAGLRGNREMRGPKLGDDRTFPLFYCLILLSFFVDASGGTVLGFSADQEK